MPKAICELIDKNLLENLEGRIIDLEIHHTAPMHFSQNPFVIHLESFKPFFFPLLDQGKSTPLSENDLVYYKMKLESKNCLGIISHIKSTLEDLDKVFASDIIRKKLFYMPIGIESREVKTKVDTGSGPVFLFINSAHQNPANFLNRGGLATLSFWFDYIRAGNIGKLVLRTSKPTAETLGEYWQELEDFEREHPETILWFEHYFSDSEMDLLFQKSDFFMIPSFSLHSHSIMRALKSGLIPIVSDANGYEEYITPNKTALVVEGVKKYIHQNMKLGGASIESDNYEKFTLSIFCYYFIKLQF